MAERTGRATAARWGAAVLVVFGGAAALGRALPAQEEDRRLIPALRLPPPVERKYLEPLEGQVRTTFSDIAFRTTLGHEVRIPLVEIVAEPGALRAEMVEASSIRIAGLEVIAPPDTITTGFNAFIEFPIPRVHVDRLVLEDAFIGALAHATQYEGRWLWWQDDIDIELRDVRLGGDAPESLRLVRADFAGERRDRPLRLAAASGTLARQVNVLDADLTARLGESELAVAGTLRRSGAFDFDVSAVPLAFRELRAVLPQLPVTGGATLDARIASDAEGLTVELRRMIAQVLESSAVATGTIRTGSGGAVRDLVVEFPALASADLDSLYGLALPGGGVWSGALNADGPFASGVALAGSIERVAPARTSRATHRNGEAAPRFSVEGTYRTEPGDAVALVVEASDMPVRDATAGGTLRASGPLDSLTVTGTVRGSGGSELRTVAADVDAVILAREDAPRRARATAELHALVRDDPTSPPREIAATVNGSAELAEDGRLDARLVTEPVPLAILPLPAAIDSVHGDATADLTVTGTLETPRLDGTFGVRGGAFRVRRAGLRVIELAGRVPVEDGVARLDGVTAVANGGPVAVRGKLLLTGDGRIDSVTATAERVELFADDSMRVLAFAEAGAAGELAAPRIRANARLVRSSAGSETELATVRGTADLATGTLAFAVRADSLPLAALPPPAGTAGLRGTVRAAVDIGGTVDEPRTRGAFELEGAGGRVTRTGTELRDLRGTASLHDGLLQIDRIVGTVGGGALEVDGEARIADGSRTLDMSLVIDRGRVVDTDSAQVIASVALRARGTVERPHVEGTVALLEGWIHEDNFARRPPIDTLAPPYGDLIERVPWIRDSRLRRGEPRPLTAEAPAEREPEIAVPPDPAEPVERVTGRETEPDGPPFTGRIGIDVYPGISMIDEDSDMYGNGRIEVVADSLGIRAEGIYRVTGGYYAQYGEVFEIQGGAMAFQGDGGPNVAIRSVHRFQAPLGSWLTPDPNVFERFPPLEFFAIGSTTRRLEEIRRLSLLPESRTELAALLLYRERVQPVTGWRTRTFWPPDDGGGAFAVSSATRSSVLLWSYIANESYDYLPLERVYLRGGIIEAGPSRPGRIAVGRYFQSGLVAGPLHAIVTQPLEGGAAPGVRLAWRIGAPELIGFSEPRFLSVAPVFGLGRVYTHGRRTGVGVRWVREW